MLVYSVLRHVPYEAVTHPVVGVYKRETDAQRRLAAVEANEQGAAEYSIEARYLMEEFTMRGIFKPSMEGWWARLVEKVVQAYRKGGFV